MLLAFRRHAFAILCACAPLAIPIGHVAGQVTSGNPSIRELVAVNTDAEQYLRVLQDLGVVQPYPWTARPFSPRELQELIPADTSHPWGARIRRRPYGFSDFYFLAPEAQAIYNSAFPYGVNDGPIWAGRGLTTALQAGFAGHVGRLSFSVEPMVFRAENQAFALMPNGQTGKLAFADGVNPTTIDQPQRFGSGPYQRLDPGQTTVRLDLPIVAVGVSTANEVWGPAIDNPIILGNNAAGFPHVFIGSSAPVDFWLFKAYGHVDYGRLDQSEYAALAGTQSRRFMSGIVASITPRGVPSLEIGGSRFFHTLWPDSGLTLHDFERPFEGILLSQVASEIGGNGQEPDNQLASLFFRWTFPRDGFETYAEYGREDHNIDRRDLTLEPDHDAAYTFGLQKSWRRVQTIWSLLGELTNARLTALALGGRPQTYFYVHTPVLQGHTDLGQALGSPAVYGGGGGVVRLDRVDASGSWTLAWTRTQRLQMESPSGVSEPSGSDVMHALSFVRTWFSALGDFTANVEAIRDLNRNFSRDVTNTRLSIGWRVTRF